MGHFINRGGVNLFVDDDGRAWNGVDKKLEYDPETFTIIEEDDTKGLTVLEVTSIEEKPDVIPGPSRVDLETTPYGELLKMAGIKRGPGASREKAIAIILGE